MANTFTLISSTALSGTAVNLTSIPQTFRHLELWVSCRDNTVATSEALSIRFNSNTTANYYRAFGGKGYNVGMTQAAAAAATRILIPDLIPGSPFQANTFGALRLVIHNYSATNILKQCYASIGYGNTADTLKGMAMDGTATLNSNTAITSINIETIGTGFATNSRAWLYGISTTV